MAEEIINKWIPKFSEELYLDKEFENAYKAILKIDEKNIDTKYSSYAAGVAYIACLMTEQLGVTQEMLALVADCSMESLRKRYKAIIRRIEVIL